MASSVILRGYTQYAEDQGPVSLGILLLQLGLSDSRPWRHDELSSRQPGNSTKCCTPLAHLFHTPKE